MALYITITLIMTNWRMNLARRSANEYRILSKENRGHNMDYLLVNKENEIIKHSYNNVEEVSKVCESSKEWNDRHYSWAIKTSSSETIFADIDKWDLYEKKE